MRELGVNPDAPELEALDKVKAGLLLHTAVDPVKPQAQRDEQ